MYCFKNRIYYHDCDRFYKDCNYLNHLRSETHCCSCNNHDHVCCISKLSLKSHVGIQTDFSDKQVSSRKQTTNYKNIDPNILIELFEKYYSGWYNGDQSIADAAAILGELRRVEAITCEHYDKFLDNCFVK